MRKRLIITNIIILLISLILFTISSIIFLNNNTKNNSEVHIHNYAVIVSNKFGDGESYEDIITYMRQIDENIRITFINKEGIVILDSYAEISENHLNKPEIVNLNQAIIRYSDSQDLEMMFYAIEKNNMYIRIGLPTENIFQDIYEILGIMFLISLAIFIIMSITLTQLNRIGMKPLNELITGFEEIIGEKQTYHYNDLSDVSLKINEVKKRISDNVDKITKERNKIAFLLNNMNQGIIVLDKAFNIFLTNNFVNQIYPIKIDEFIFSIQDKLKDIVKNEGIVIFEKENYLISCQNITADWINGEGIIIIINDISIQKENERKEKDFFTKASHELKSPLTSIIGFQEMIREKVVKTNEEIIEVSNRSLEEAKRMLSLINSMLDLSSLNVIDKNVLIEKVSVKKTIEDILNSLNPQIIKKNITTNLNLKDDYILINQNHLDLLLRNLIDNAIKYNKQDGMINLSFEKGILKIIDTGIGLSNEDKDHLFERFYRANKARVRKENSSGLGLAIVKEITDLYNTKVEVESIYNQKTIFTLHFKLVK